MRTATRPSHSVRPVYSRAAARRRRLHRAIECWDIDRRLSAEPTRRVALITLTLDTDDPEQAHGLARDFWGRVRHRFIGTRYFCWLELQKRGRIHYHALWINPPGRRRADLVYLVDKWWGRGRTQVRFQDAAWVDRVATDYVYGYVKKQGAKYYQQQYDDLPRSIRSFMYGGHELPFNYLVNHRDRDIYQLVWDQPQPWDKPDWHLVLTARGGCLFPGGGPCQSLRHAIPQIRRHRPRRRKKKARAELRTQLHRTLNQRLENRKTSRKHLEALPKSGRSG